LFCVEFLGWVLNIRNYFKRRGFAVRKLLGDCLLLVLLIIVVLFAFQQNGVDILSYAKDVVSKKPAVSIDVLNVQETKNNIYSHLGYKPSDGNIYVFVTVRLKNVGKENITYRESYFKVKNSKGQIMGIDSAPYEGRINGGELAPDGEKVGKLEFQIPINDTSLKLIYDDGSEENGLELNVNVR